MTPEKWPQVKQLFQATLEREPEARLGFLQEACDGDDDLLREVASLLNFDQQAGGFIEEPAIAAVPELVAEARASAFVGRRIGPYQILKEIGHGGMGAVYLAERADEQYQKQVAIKLVKQGFDNAFSVKRFLSERQILANLDHPNIANLLDGGTIADGLPYLVMEYVDGVPINEYCDSQKLPIPERLKLFRTVCAAVAHAHRNLVIHRDLKPSNVLVTAQGNPKLLDFGIAKIFGTEGSDQRPEQTATSVRLMTPDYASPEQVRGENITTSSDIYTLGVLLYKLLTGHHPYRFARNVPQEIERVVCEQEPERPSTVVSRTEDTPSGEGPTTVTLNPDSVSNNRDTQPDKLRRLLNGDLDNIVLMAMRKEPQRRYSSVDQLSEDIKRHLEGLPVIARKDTFTYRSTKFIKRHKVGAAAVLLIVLATIVGLTTTIWQARIARAERAKAERRFNDVRKLANSNLFELHDAIANLPGSTPARELLVKRALEYLDSLAQEARDDPSLQGELVAAYLKVGNVQGNPNNANLGDTAGALQSYRKALAIAERLTSTNPADAKARRFLAVISEKMSDVQSATGDIVGAVESSRRSLAIFEEISTAASANVEARQSLAISHIKLGDVLGNPSFPNFGDQAGAMQSYRASAEILESLDAANPTNPKTRRLLGLIYERLGTMLALEKSVDSALAAYRKSLAMREMFVTDHPTNSDAIRDVAIAYEKIADMMTEKKELKEALESRNKSLEIFQRLVQLDPRNVQAQQSLAISYVHLADLLGNPESRNLGRPTEALKNYRLALAVLRATDDPAATGNVKTRETLELIQQRLSALHAHP